MLGQRVGYITFFSAGCQLSAKLDSRLRNNFKRWFEGSGKGDERVTLLANDMREMDTYWNELIYSVCKGDVSQMKDLKKFDIMDFFDYIDNKTKDNGRG